MSAVISEPTTMKAPANLAQLVREHQADVWRYLRYLGASAPDADDLTQDVFVKIHKNLRNFRQDSQLYSWIYRIATNEALTFIKQRARKSPLTNLALQEKIVANLASDPDFDGDAIQIKLQQAILVLPEKQQLVFKMRYFEEIKYEEMSEILGTSVGALKASYHHAVKKIEKFMTQE